jgi:hypothetical protein
VPSTGQISWGSTTITSPTATSESGMSAMPAAVLRWASDGIRRASAVEHVAGPAHRPRSSASPAGEHQHDEHAGEVFAEENARDDRDAGEQVGAKRAGEELREQIPDERHAPENEHRHQRQVGERERAAGKPAAGIERPERTDRPAGRRGPTRR